MQFNRIHIPLAKGIYAVAQATRAARGASAQNLSAPPSLSHKTLANLAPLAGATVHDLKSAKKTPPPVPPRTWIPVVAERALRGASQLSVAPNLNPLPGRQGSMAATGKPSILPRPFLSQARPPLSSKMRYASNLPTIPPKPFVSSDRGVGHVHRHAQHLPTPLQNREIYRLTLSAQHALSPHRGGIKNDLNRVFAQNDAVSPRPAQNDAQQVKFSRVNNIASFIQKAGLWNAAEGDFALEWIASHPALTDGRPLHILQGSVPLKLAPASEILDNRPIHIVRTVTKDAAGVESAHYSAAKLVNGQPRVFNTAGDGDCFFRSVLAGVAGIPPEQVAKSDIQKMRNWAAASILANKAEIEKRFSEVLR